MPIISKITAAKKKKGRFHIYIKVNNKDQYAFTVSEDLLVREQLLRGKDMSEDDITLLQEKDDLDKAMQKVLNFLSYRMRSELEVFNYLKELEVSDDQIGEMMDRLRELEFVNDRLFAEAFVRTKRDTGKKGPLIIEQELHQKGISQGLIDDAMTQYTIEQQLEHAIIMIDKKQSSYKNEGLKKKQQKLIQFIIQRGYPHSIAVEALKEVDLKEDPEVEWGAIEKQGEKAWRKFENKPDWERDQRIKQFLFSRGFTTALIEQWLQSKKEENMT
ncbi:recombination regulator RecX [Salipaludibacillus sp. LMS25]|uniref:recombination regulator RecX n=1 Tax=Salipaludibacillus sp. LMS25 TaxID=2924031 RepID=UPI0020D1C580|nr:recombination regulator RecX [Salipaludibacillus sp. LMS25]UTR14061.1 recombination regulator RecX [Salipaludibacillus sp. LMS25]